MIQSILEATNTFKTNETIHKVIENEKKHLKKTNNPHLTSKYQELDAITMYTKGKGLPIGNLSSQILAVFYLNDLDHYIKEVLHCKYYIRYMDDFVIFHEDKKYLQDCLEKIRLKLQKDCDLELHPKKTKIFSFHQGLTFLGYRFIVKNNRLVVLMSPKTKKRITKNIKRVYKKKPQNKENVLASYKGYLLNCECNSYLKKNHFHFME